VNSIVILHILCIFTFSYFFFPAEMITIRFYRLDIRKDGEFATGYRYPKTAFKREPDMDPDIRNTFIDISRIRTFGKSCTLQNHSFFVFRSKFFSLLRHDSESVYGVSSVLQCNPIPSLNLLIGHVCLLRTWTRAS